MRVQQKTAVPVLLTLLAGCMAPQTNESELAAPEPEMTIRGSLAFSDNVAPPPGSVATITVDEFGDGRADPLASETVEIESTGLVSFELDVPVSRFDPSRQYAVTAEVSAGDGGRWTTNIAQLIDVTREQADVGILLMTRSRAGQDPDRD